MGQMVLHSLEYRTFAASRPQEEEQKRKVASKAAISLQPQPVQYLRWQITLPNEREKDSYRELEPQAERSRSGDETAESLEEPADATSSVQDTLLRECRVGEEVSAIVMLPDRCVSCRAPAFGYRTDCSRYRPLDLQLSALTEESVEADAYPIQLSEYSMSLQTL